MMENSGMIPNCPNARRERQVSSASVLLHFLQDPVDPDSAPKKIMAQPARRIASSVASE